MPSKEELLFWLSPAQCLTVTMPALIYPLSAVIAPSRTRAVILDG